MTVDPKAFSPSAVQAIDAEASVLMKRGIRLMGEAQPDAVIQALDCFDRALELRRRLPIESAPLLGYGLAACCLNRADALMRLRDTARIAAALRAYDEAIVLLRSLPMQDDPRFPRRLAIAHQNRGLALQARDPSAPREAIVSFTDAVAVLDDDRAALIPDRQYLLAAIWMNLANARAAETTPESDVLAYEAARRALALVADLEADDGDAVEVGLKARHVLCQVIAKRPLPAGVTDGAVPDAVHEATDVVDEGLALARRWEQKGVVRFRSVACDLFRFGARVYQRYQPQFLDEFVFDNLDASQSSADYVESAEMQSAAREALQLSNRKV